MIWKNIFTATRHFKNQKFSSVLCIFGLSIAITSCLFLFLYIFDEFQYDEFNVNKEKIVRLVELDKKTGDRHVIFPAVYYSKMISTIPEIETASRLFRSQQQLVDVSNKKFYEDIYFADKEILEMFTFPLVRGNKTTVLSAPNSVVLTDDMANKYFGNSDPVGKILKIENSYELKVTGILKNIPVHSHIKPTILISISTLNKVLPHFMELDVISSCFYYFQLKNNVSIPAAEENINKFFIQLKGKEAGNYVRLLLEPLKNIHLYSTETGWDFAEHGDIDTVKSFILIAIMILIMAVFNYTNLLTTLVKIRDKEFAVKKLLGAERSSILKQFILETIIFITISLFISVFMVTLLMNSFNQLSGKELSTEMLLNWRIIISTSAMLFLTALFSVIYPAFVALKSDSLNRLKGSFFATDFKISRITLGFRQVVTGIQFAITISLIAATIVIYNQMLYTQNARFGFNKEHLLTIENPYGEKMYERYEVFKNKMAEYPEIQSISASDSKPGSNISNFSFVRQSGKPAEQNVNVAQVAVDYGIFNTYQTKLLEGRDFSKNISTDKLEAVVINKAAAELLGLKNPIGSRLSGLFNASDNQIVIGVVENMHFKSFKEKVTPIVFYLRDWSSSNLIVRLKSNDILRTMKIIEKEWNDVLPDRPVYYSFIDEAFDKLYTAENRTANIIFLFCVLAISIALIGLLSLVTLTIQMRRKEIGVRKVLGASVQNIISMMTGEYLFIILTANVVAFPVAYYLLSKWLERFVYRIEISAWAFVIAGIIALLIGLSAVCYKIIRAALTNPVESIRYE